VPAFIAVGHSKWFKTFLQKYLKSNDESHMAIERRLDNCCVVAFRMGFNVETKEHFIPESTVTVLYKGFVEKWFG